MLNIVAVTACVSGVAHTYMAAERLEKLCHQERWHASIETQGALGTENALSEGDLKQADVALLITDIEINGQGRFAGMRTIKTSIRTFLLHPEKITEVVRHIKDKPVVHLVIE